MNTDQALNSIKTLIGTLTEWLRAVAGLVFAVLLLSTLCSMAGYPIPSVPAIRANMQELGILAAGLCFALWKR